MNIIRLIEDRAHDASAHKIPTIAFLGDSVTHGVFELIPVGSTGFLPVFDTENVYHSVLKKMIGEKYPGVSVTVVNAGINGEGAPQGLSRLERDVLAYAPDLTVVCFGLNDVCKGPGEVAQYTASLGAIFRKLRSAGGEVIYMTPNMMATEVHHSLPEGILRDCAALASGFQNDGTMDAYIEAGKKTAEECGVTVCDVYAKWKEMQTDGKDITDILSNHINHPPRELHRLFAEELWKTMIV